MREKIRVPRKAYDEIMVLNREIHFSLKYPEIIKMADDRGYTAAADWLRNNEDQFMIGSAWGFEPVDEGPSASRPTPKPDDELRLRTSQDMAQPEKKPPATKKKTGGFFSRLFGK